MNVGPFYDTGFPAMLKPQQPLETLSYATPAAQAKRFPILAATSLFVSCLSTLFQMVMTFREGLTPSKADRQILTGVLCAIIGGLLAASLALISYRQNSRRSTSHVALVISAATLVYAVIHLR